MSQKLGNVLTAGLPERPRRLSAAAFERLPTGIAALVQRRDPQTSPPSPTFLANEFFGPHGARSQPTLTPLGGDSFSLQAGNIRVDVRSPPPGVTSQEALTVAATQLITAAEIQRHAEQALGRSLPWGLGASVLVLKPFERVSYDLNAFALPVVETPDTVHVVFDYDPSRTRWKFPGRMHQFGYQRHPATIAHEVAHHIVYSEMGRVFGKAAIPDQNLGPEQTLAYGALHEGAADILAMAERLSNAEVVEHVLKETGCDLHLTNEVSILGASDVLSRHGWVDDANYYAFLIFDRSEVRDRVVEAISNALASSLKEEVGQQQASAVPLTVLSKAVSQSLERFSKTLVPFVRDGSQKRLWRLVGLSLADPQFLSQFRTCLKDALSACFAQAPASEALVERILTFQGTEPLTDLRDLIGFHSLRTRGPDDVSCVTPELRKRAARFFQSHVLRLWLRDQVCTEGDPDARDASRIVPRPQKPVARHVGGAWLSSAAYQVLVDSFAKSVAEGVPELDALARAVESIRRVTLHAIPLCGSPASMTIERIQLGFLSAARSYSPGELPLWEEAFRRREPASAAS